MHTYPLDVATGKYTVLNFRDESRSHIYRRRGSSMRTAQTRIRSQPESKKEMEATLRLRRSVNSNAIGRRCLVVDDDTIVMRLVANMLMGLGYHVDMAENGSIALSRITMTRYDVVVSDLEMPLINGFLLASKIKSCSDNTKTVIMTGRCHAEVINLMTPAIVDAWLFKPFNLDELCRVLDDLGGPSKQLRSAAAL
jgi:CheY-like chemotaxis protein